MNEKIEIKLLNEKIKMLEMNHIALRSVVSAFIRQIVTHGELEPKFYEKLRSTLDRLK